MSVLDTYREAYPGGVQCPECGALPGRGCVNGHGKRTASMHKPRTESARLSGEEELVRGLSKSRYNSMLAGLRAVPGVGTATLKRYIKAVLASDDPEAKYRELGGE